MLIQSPLLLVFYVNGQEFLVSMDCVLWCLSCNFIEVNCSIHSFVFYTPMILLSSYKQRHMLLLHQLFVLYYHHLHSWQSCLLFAWIHRVIHFWTFVEILLFSGNSLLFWIFIFSFIIHFFVPFTFLLTWPLSVR